MALAKKANALNADAAAGWYHSTMYYDYYLHGDYEHALELRRRTWTNKRISTPILNTFPIYGQLGRKQEALETWHKLLAEDPDWTAESFETW